MHRTGLKDIPVPDSLCLSLEKIRKRIQLRSLFSVFSQNQTWSRRNISWVRIVVSWVVTMSCAFFGLDFWSWNSSTRNLTSLGWRLILSSSMHKIAPLVKTSRIGSAKEKNFWVPDDSSLKLNKTGLQLLPMWTVLISKAFSAGSCFSSTRISSMLKSVAFRNFKTRFIPSPIQNLAVESDDKPSVPGNRRVWLNQSKTGFSCSLFN